MTNGDPKGWILYPTLSQIMDSISCSPLTSCFKLSLQTSLKTLRCITTRCRHFDETLTSLDNHMCGFQYNQWTVFSWQPGFDNMAYKIRISNQGLKIRCSYPLCKKTSPVSHHNNFFWHCHCLRPLDTIDRWACMFYEWLCVCDKITKPHELTIFFTLTVNIFNIRGLFKYECK